MIMNNKEHNQLADNAAINIQKIAKTFGSRWVLKSIDFSALPGQSICLCGVNGAGKSTLLKIISGLLQPDRGSVSINGFDIGTDPEKTKSHLGVISHKSMVYSDLTVFENIHFFAMLYGVKNPAQRINKLLEDVGLAAYRYDKASILSRGLLQRLAIVRALVHEPAILLADEPFTGLDAPARQHLLDVLGSFAGEGGTVVMTTHDVNIALKCCSRIVVLDGGKLVFDAQTSDIDGESFSRDYLAYAKDNK